MNEVEKDKAELPDDKSIKAMKPLLDPNVYATKKTVAQGMLDVALLTSNASQLKFLLQKGRENDFYVLMVTLISLSIVLQIGTGCAILAKSTYNINKEAHQRMAMLLNNVTFWLIFWITVLNVFISAFGLEQASFPKVNSEFKGNATVL